MVFMNRQIYIQNIVSVEDYKVVEKTDEIGWDIFIRMELLTPFNTYTSDKKLAEADVIKLGIDICTALEICGKRNIIHRDIKPENIFINDFGYFKLGDFGIARKLENMTGGLSQKGSFNYMAPEVANSSCYDARVDTYSLGIVLFKLLNENRLPFLDSEKQLLNYNDRRNAVERRIQGDPIPVPCKASPEMGNLILRACAYEPNQRFATASEMKKALEAVSNGSYVIIPVDVDTTTAVRHAKSDLNGTTAVRRAHPEVKAKHSKSFGKKKSKTPKIIAIIAVMAIVIAGAAIFVPKILGDKDNTPPSSTETIKNRPNSSDTSENAVENAKFDDEQITAIIVEADMLAKDEDYESALAKIQTGLNTYPESEALLAKEAELIDALEVNAKQRTLEEAENLSKSGDYVSAIALIRNAQDTYVDDTDFQNAYKSYSASYKVQIISEADELASNGNYDGAIQKTNEAIAVIGEEKELLQKINEYQLEVYLSQAESYIESQKYAEALATLDTAEELLGKQERINYKRMKTKKAQLLNKVALYEESGDYVAAINATEQCEADLQSEPEVIQKRNTLRTVYKDKVLQDAESAFAASGYDAAIKILNESLSVFPDDAVIVCKIEEYQSYAPVHVKDLVATRKKDCSFYNSTTVSDPRGNEYSNALVLFSHSRDWISSSGLIEFYTGKQYSIFSCEIVPEAEYSTTSGYGGKIKIYSDNNLIYTSDIITYKTESIKVELDISNTEYLKIQIENVNPGGLRLADADTLLINPYVRK